MDRLLRDIGTVIKKELKEIIILSLSLGQILSSAIFILLFGLFIPYEQGEYFLRQTFASLSLYIFLVPLLMSSGLVADSFAGERERKTLEALFATRLPDAAIFIGKVMAVFIYTYVFTVIIVLTGAAGANIYLYRAGHGMDFFYNALSSFALFVFTIPVIFAGIAVGVFFSLRCRDLRTAYQLSRIGWLIICLPLVVGWVKFMITWEFLVPAFYILSGIDAILLFTAIRFFNRAKTPF